MYKVQKMVLAEAPEITHDDVMSLKAAADLLGITLPGIDSLLRSGALLTVIDDTTQTAYGKPRRLVLRREVERLAKQRALAGAA